MSNTLPSNPVSAEKPAPPCRSATGVVDDPALRPAREECPLLDWGCTATVNTPAWRLLSVHSTSSGEVEYCTCSCNAIVVLCRGEVIAFIGLPRGDGPGAGRGRE
ncbi:hypothetical protein GCM10020295_81810 [Streptomyces cinereospinus]